MVADGIYCALALAGGGGVVSFLTRPIHGLPMFLLAEFWLCFFRDPDREVPAEPRLPVAAYPSAPMPEITPEGPRCTRSQRR